MDDAYLFYDAHDAFDNILKHIKEDNLKICAPL
jgi:hypothetical protein